MSGIYTYDLNEHKLDNFSKNFIFNFLKSIGNNKSLTPHKSHVAPCTSLP